MASEPTTGLHPWQWKALPLLGKDADKVVAKKCGVDPGAVRRFRERLEIPGARPAARQQWQEIAKPLLGKKSDAHIARMVNRSHEVVRRYRKSLGIPSKRAALLASLEEGHGAKTDTELAKEFDTGARTVRKLRHKVGTPAHPKTRRKNATRNRPENSALDRPARQKGQAEKTAGTLAPLRDAAA